MKIQDSTSPGIFDITETCFQRAVIAIERGDLALAEEMHGRALALLEKQSPGGLRWRARWCSGYFTGLGIFTVALNFS
ncbi:MAG TPA: hypothetical protein VKK31_27965 [Thermoanaerobaculia bacterium]|nr:hypothetical protein [Thermoanaerobaculia bacterium]